MATKLDWKTVPKSGIKPQNSGSGDRKEINRIKFTDECSYIVRPVGPPVGFFSFYSKALNKFFRCDLNNKELAQQLQELLGVDPSPKFAINVIDRADSIIKVMECPWSVYTDMVDVCSTKQTSAGGRNGGDWKISTKAIKGKNGRTTRRYNANYLGKEPFTEEELLRVENEDPAKNEWYILDDLYKETEIDYVKSLLSDSPEPKSEKAAPKKEWKEDAEEPTKPSKSKVSTLDEADF